MPTTARKKSSVAKIGCMNEEHCTGTIRVVGEIKQSPARKLGVCPVCKMLHVEDGGKFDTVHGTIGQYVERLTTLNQSGDVIINATGRRMGLDQFAGHFGR